MGRHWRPKRRSRGAVEEASLPDLPPWLTIEHLKRLTGLTTDAGISYRVRQGLLPSQDPHRRLWARDAVLRAVRRLKGETPGAKPVGPRAGRGGRGEKKANGVGEGEQEAKDGGSSAEFDGLDPDTHYRLAKAKIEELRLRKMRDELVDAKTTELRVASFVGLVKSTIEAFPAKHAPGIAARVEVREGRVDEGSMYREIQNAIRGTLEQIAGMDLKAALAKGVDDDDEQEDVEAFEQAAKKFEKKKKQVKKEKKA